MSAKLLWKSGKSATLPANTITHNRDRLLAALDEAIEALHGGNREPLETFIRRLLERTIASNAEEERLMQEADYPEYEEHRQQHQAFEMRLHTLESALRRGQSAFRIAHSLRTSLQKWLINHIGHSDTEYLPQLQRANPLRRYLDYLTSYELLKSAG